MMKSASILVSTIALSSAAVAQPEFIIEQAKVLAGDPVSVQVRGLEPGSLTIINASRFNNRSQAWYDTSAAFRADEQGRIDPMADAPVAGRWTGADPTGLFWSMQRAEPQAEPPASPRAWGLITFSVDVDADGTPDATGEVELLRGRDDLVEIPVGDSMPGAFLMRPPGDDRLPVVIALGGSEGNDGAARSVGRQLASRGFAVLGLPYHSPAWGDQEQKFPELPRAFANLPLEPLRNARDWIRTRDDLDGEHIGIWGVSKGGEFALAGASRIEGFSAIVAYVPSDVIWEGWGVGRGQPSPSSFSWEGKPLPFVPYLGMGAEFAKGQRDQPVKIRLAHDAGRLANPDRIAEARIEVEIIDEPVMLVGGDGDTTWDSGDMVRNIKERRDAAGLETLLIVDREAGHGLSGHAYTPLDRHAAAVRREAFPAMIEFFRTHLGVVETNASK